MRRFAVDGCINAIADRGQFRVISPKEKLIAQAKSSREPAGEYRSLEIMEIIVAN
ncbi:hypothetical protein GCM10011396_34010 [Undibacterium terreum]|uniref:Uncharacterized protein n=1 Tax=Undibacterium terreum TaxID=1224302 RepID=A0A916XLC4_9BURK|nr:hypothetical protein GCM10011396_34010 [Undibacterium terreum]